QVSPANIPGNSLTYWQMVALGAALPSIGDTGSIVNINTPAAAAGPAQWTWGKIVSLVNQLTTSGGGIAYIGNMLSEASLGQAFDGSTSQAAANSIGFNYTASVGVTLFNCYAGLNLAGASPTSQAIGSVTIYPTSDKGWNFPPNSSTYFLSGLTFTIYGKNTLPANGTDGTVLGTYTVPNSFNNAAISLPNAPVTILTTSTTAYTYLWVYFNGSTNSSVTVPSTFLVA